jgi:predicted RNA methylase
MSALRHLLTKLRRDGVLTTFRAAVHWGLRRLRREGPSEFDQVTGLQTDGLVSSWQVRLVSPEATPGSRYQPTPAELARRMIASLPIAYSDFHFVDLGCGKGRVLFIAEEFGFRSVTGVEYGEELAEVARRNVAQAGKQDRIEVRWQDASTYEIPDRTVVFMYNPFGAAVMSAVAAAIGRARDVHVIYFEPKEECARLLDGVAKRVRSEGECVFFRRD